MVTLPTVDVLDAMSASQNMLLLFRVLHSSDGLTQTFQLLEVSTLKDLVEKANGLHQMDTNERLGDGHDLTWEENAELIYLIENITQYIDNQK
jgi:transcriptional regulator of heat shock response